MKSKLACLLLFLTLSSVTYAEDWGNWLKKSPSEEWEETLKEHYDKKPLDTDTQQFQGIYDSAYVSDPEIQDIAETYRESCLLKIEKIMRKKVLPNRRGKGILNILVRSNGKLDEVEVAESSGDQILDEAMKHAVYLASPFEPFPSEMRTILEPKGTEYRYMRMAVKFTYMSHIGGYSVDEPIFMR